MFKISSKYLDVVLKASIISACLSSERDINVDTNAYKLQPSMSERVVVDGHGCHTALHFGVKAKKTQDKVPTLYWLPKLHKIPIKQDLLLILVLVLQQNFLNCNLMSYSC